MHMSHISSADDHMVVGRSRSMGARMGVWVRQPRSGHLPSHFATARTARGQGLRFKNRKNSSAAAAAAGGWVFGRCGAGSPDTVSRCTAVRCNGDCYCISQRSILAHSDLEWTNRSVRRHLPSAALLSYKTPQQAAPRVVEVEATDCYLRRQSLTSWKVLLHYIGISKDSSNCTAVANNRGGGGGGTFIA